MKVRTVPREVGEMAVRKPPSRQMVQRYRVRFNSLHNEVRRGIRVYYAPDGFAFDSAYTFLHDTRSTAVVACGSGAVALFCNGFQGFRTSVDGAILEILNG